MSTIEKVFIEAFKRQSGSAEMILHLREKGAISHKGMIRYVVVTEFYRRMGDLREGGSARSVQLDLASELGISHRRVGQIIEEHVRARRRNE